MAEEQREVPWLRDMVEEDLLGLFSDDEEVTQAAVRRLIREASRDPDLEDRLVELLQTALDLGNDDSSASVWATVILGEMGSEKALGALLQSLASDEDEALQDAAGVALLRIGEPALKALMEKLEEGENPELSSPGYRLLGQAGVLGDDGLRTTIMDFLESRVEMERRRPPAKGSLESLFFASAYLGDRRQIEIMKKVLAEDFRGNHPGIQDAIEMLSENTAGTPIESDRPPWLDRYDWLFTDEREEARIRRQGPQSAPPEGEKVPEEEMEDGEESKRRSDLSLLYWGLSATADSAEEEPESDYDARRFLERPGDAAEDDEEEEQEQEED